MKLIALSSLAALLLAGVPTCRVDDVASDSEPITHELWDEQLDTYVDADGWVDYDGWLRDTARLNAYLELLAGHHPNEANWSDDERLAYWINAYNAYTVKILLDNWPQASIKDIKGGIGFVNSIWDQEFITIEGQEYSLNNLEHGIIRPKFQDPRIHAAVNCASVSCPVLRGEAYVAERLDEQLDDQARRWFDGVRNDLSDPSAMKLSSIFKWYGGDFEWDGGSKAAFVERHAGVELPDDPDFEYLEYDWGINSQQANAEGGAPVR